MVFVRYLTYVPVDTAMRVQQLCREVVAAKTSADTERIMPELRAALEEHIRLAKDSLGAQASAIAVLDELASKDFQTPDPKIAA